jgi:C4-dicarboxylate transporter DctQ subunit
MLHKLEVILSKAEEMIILLCIVSSLLFVFVNIVLRYFFARGFVSAEEYARYTMVLLVYIGASQVVKKRGMIRVDVLSVLFQRFKFPIDVLSNLISLLTAVCITVFAFQFTIWQFSTGQKSIAMELPLWIAYGVVPLGGCLMVMRYIVDTIVLVKENTGKDTKL